MEWRGGRYSAQMRKDRFEPGCADTSDARDASTMSDQLLDMLRDRVATRFYDRPEIIDATARAMLRTVGVGRLH